jgi:transposase
VYVKPFTKRQKSDVRDAAAIVEAAQRPTMRFVAVKTEQAQARSMVFRTRALLVQQRTQTVNALRGHLAEFGLVAARGVANVEQLWQAFGESAESLPELVVRSAGLLFDRITEVNAQIGELDKQIRTLVREHDELRRLTTVPGVGDITAMAVHAFAPPMESFGRGRDFAAWIGLTPREVSTGGRQRLGRITKMGQRDLRRLLVLGAMTVIRHARRRKEIESPWLRRLLAEKPTRLVAVALANKMARIIWAMMVSEESYSARKAMGVPAG